MSRDYFQYFSVTGRDRKWGICVTTVGQANIPPHTKYPPRGHPAGYDFDWDKGRIIRDYMLVYISKGRGWFETLQGKKRYRVEAGHVMLLFPKMWHRYMPDAATGWHEHWIGFDGNIVEQWIKFGLFKRENPVLRTAQEDVLLMLFSDMLETAKTKRPALQRILAGATMHILGLLSSAQQASPASGGVSQMSVQKAITAIHLSLNSRIDLTGLARQSGISYSWFRRIFAQHTGSSPRQYILEMRLIRAKNLLAQTRLPVNQIAAQTGFADAYYFSRLFRRNAGVTPSRWRKRAQAAPGPITRSKRKG
ncbi:MAG TPA: AraC family transcriptional regulator [Candidatus Saccharimonadales bacterium]|nr:AraC family transcriptional regulator [Candidatus Saccharimonadales bacterium]